MGAELPTGKLQQINLIRYYTLHEFTIEEVEGCEDAKEFLYMKNWDEEGKKKSKTEATIAKVGDKACGGIIYFVDDTERHGLVVTEFDLPTEFDWQSAQRNCCGLMINDFTDWRVPIAGELQKLQQAQVIQNPKYCYWSSTSSDKDMAYAVYFYDGRLLGGNKTQTAPVRLIRSF